MNWLRDALPEPGPDSDFPIYVRNDALATARMEAFDGLPRRALVTLEQISAPTPDSMLLRASALATIGRFDLALRQLNDPQLQRDPRAMMQRTKIDCDLGRYVDALASARAAVAAAPDAIASHYWLAYATEASGDIAGARREYQWFVDPPQSWLDAWRGHPDAFTDAEQVTLLGRALDRWATLTSAYEKDPSLHDTILNIFVRAYDQIDRSYWPAHVAAAEYFLSHDDQADAADELDAANTLNPTDPSIYAVGGKIALANFDFDKVDAAADVIRQTNPTSIDADFLDARNLLQQRLPSEALAPLSRILARQPNLEALGLQAAAQALLLHDGQCAAILQQADKLYPDQAVAYFEVAEQLSAMRQYDRAAAMYKVAVTRAPWWTTARDNYGLLFTQSGDEDQARVVLEAAHALDPFNVRATNYLRLLDELSGFTKKESAHFIVMYDAKADPVIPEYFTDYLESIYPQVTGAFDQEPPRKTMIEVFPTHAAFSVRTTGAPWIGTVGASTGRVIALVAPRKQGSTLGPFNWSQVLRHEFTHTVTLAATDNRIAHWFTEGLAVQQEHSPMRWEWVPMLYTAVSEHHLFTLENLTWGFVRPRTPMDRQLAYAQSEWICEYIESTYGHAAILKMLHEFKLGHSQADAFQNALGVDENTFGDAFYIWCQKQIATWGYDPATTAKYETLKAQAAELDEQGDYPGEAAIWEQIVAMRPVDQLPHQKLAGLYLRKVPNEAKAIANLKLLADVELKDNAYSKGLARRYREINDLPDAQKYARRAVYIDPYDPVAHALLAKIDEEIGDKTDLAREQRVIPILKQWLADQEASQDTPAPGN